MRQDLASSLLSGNQIDVILLDFAFDKVPHRGLLHKLEFVAAPYNGLKVSYQTGNSEYWLKGCPLT